jgi:hypothetical protein
MRVGQVIARAPLDCPQITLYVTVFYGQMNLGSSYRLMGFAYGPDGAYTQRTMLAEYADQEEFTEKEFASVMASAGFCMPARPNRVGMQHIYKLRPIPKEETEQSYSFTLGSKSAQGTAEGNQRRTMLETFERQLDANA